MIARLTGQLAEKELDHVIVDVGGVGYWVNISTQAFYALPEPPALVSLLIHTAVREDDISLYGFTSAMEKRLFLMLDSVSKVGPRAAMNMLSNLQPADMLQAIAAGDTRALAKVHGIGKKTAERLVVELGEKATALLQEAKLETPPPTARLHGTDLDAVSALVNLGYRPAEAEQAVAEVRQTLGESVSLPELVRATLKRIAKG